MNIQLSLPESAISRLREEAARSGQDLESFVRYLVLNKFRESESATVHRPRNHDEWLSELDAFIASHPARPAPADASRESIYFENSQ